MKRKLLNAWDGKEADAAVYERMTADGTEEIFGGVTVTNEEVVFNHYLKKVYAPCADIVWAYKRVEDSHVNLGCCGGVLQEFIIVLMNAKKQKATVKFDRERYADILLEMLEKRAPQVRIGYTTENREYFA